MPSVYVTWSGRCPDEDRREAIGRRISSVADLAAGLIEQRHQNAYNGRIEGSIIADVGLFPPGLVEQVSPLFVRLPPVYLRGSLFRLADSSDSYPGEDRVSFVFASLLGPKPSAQSPAGADGVLVWAEDASQCRLYEDPTIAGVDWYLRKPMVHLRYFAEGWMDHLLEFVRHFHMPELWYWNQADLSGARLFSGIDPGDELGREIAWRNVLAGLLDALSLYLPRELEESVGRELPAIREHLLRNGEVPRVWWTTPYERLPLEVTIADDLSVEERSAISRSLMFADAELKASLRQTIRALGKGLNLQAVPLRFNGADLTLTSRFDNSDQILRVEVRPRRAAPQDNKSGNPDGASA